MVTEFLVISPDAENHCKAGENVTVVGNNIPEFKGVIYELEGTWKVHPSFGLQLRYQRHKEIVERNHDSIVGYLSSGIIDGCGVACAEKIYKAFGEDTLDILDANPDRLKEIQGISSKKAKRIKASYQESRKKEELYTLLSSYAIPKHIIQKIEEVFDANAVSIVRNNPYELCNVDGMSFPKVDDFVRNAKIPGQDISRIKMAILYVLHEWENQGNLGMPVSLLLGNKQSKDKSVITLPMVLKNPRPANEIVLNVFENMARSKEIIVTTDDKVFRESVYRIETEVAQEFVRIVHEQDRGNLGYNFNQDEEIRVSEQKLSINLDELQKVAVREVLQNNLVIVTGGPGTGKTAVLNVLADVIERKTSKKLLFLAPTGKAARRITESTGYDAKTIHKGIGLGIKEGCERKHLEQIGYDLVIVDESSFLDIYVAKHLLSVIGKNTQLLFIGDADQLPSVGPG
ncbi:MAG: AAA family ATPase, partial [Pseudomonadota bacterium]|nr:AAA family ATPase [Pseudomonadota bacterium]